ncbi:MAG: oligoendopeptidase, partial [Candidatus Zixiibacteriota bacterium]
MTTTTKIPPAPTWDLDSIFPGGSKSTEFKNFRDKIKNDLVDAERMITGIPATMKTDNIHLWTAFILKLQAILADILTTMSFAHCLTSQNVEDTLAHSIEGDADIYYAQWEKLRSRFEALSLKQTDTAWNELVASPGLSEIKFYLNEMRENAKRKMPLELEQLALDLSVNGYHAWNRLYDKMAGDIRVEFNDRGEKKMLSMGQIATKMSDPDRAVRQLAFEKMTEGWKSRADLAAMALNAQAGFRLSLYKNRKWDSPLYEPLMMARLQQKTLDTMWAVILRETPRLTPYIEAKKKLLNIDKFRWY